MKENKYDIAEFKKMRMALTVSKFLKAIEVDSEEEIIYEGVKSIHYYDEMTYFFEIEEGERWEFEPFRASNKKFIYLRDYENLIESDDFNEVEKVVFQDYLNRISLNLK